LFCFNKLALETNSMWKFDSSKSLTEIC